jgi:succinate-semialdehyde dehydrogenase/glutarate-semialdehyde dehydrogenase
VYEDLCLYINGQFLKGEGRKEQDIYNPATDEVIGKLPHASKADLDLALTSAHKAFQSWKKSSPLERSRILRKVGELAERAPTRSAATSRSTRASRSPKA